MGGGQGKTGEEEGTNTFNDSTASVKLLLSPFNK